MLKYLIYLTAGYLIFKVVKNGVYVALKNLHKPSELNDTTELIKCDQCGSFFKETTLINFNEKNFCSEICKQNYKNETQ